MSKHVEGPNFDRIAESRQIIKEAREDREEWKRLREINAEMLAALRALMDTVNGNMWARKYFTDAQRRAARAAIAKAEGTAERVMP